MVGVPEPELVPKVELVASVVEDTIDEDEEGEDAVVA